MEPTTPKRRYFAGIAIVTVVGFVAPVVLARAFGALGIVRNDDWSYLLTLFRWVETGKLDFNNWVSMTLLAQLVFAAPIVMVFDRAITLVQLETALLGLAGLFLVMWITHRVTRKFWFGVFVAVLVAVGPMWGALAVSFMTDVPAFTLSMLVCAFGVRAFAGERVSLPMLGAGMAAGVVAFSIRQYAAVPLIAIVMIAALLLWKERATPRLRTFVIMVVVAMGSIAVFMAFWRTIPHPKLFSPSQPTGYSVKSTLYKGTGLLRVVGLLVSPAILLAGPGNIVRRSWQTAKDTTVFVTIGTLALLIFTGIEGPNIAFAGNYIVPEGILGYGVSGGARPDLFPGFGFELLIAIATVAVVLLALALVPFLHSLPGRWRSRELGPRDPQVAFIALVVTGYALAYFTASFFGIPLYDRYVLPVVPLVCILLLRPAKEVASSVVSTPTRSRALAATGAIGLVLLAVVGLAYTADSASFDGTRWKVATAATQQGWARAQVGGGFEWNNYNYRARVPDGADRLRPCVVVILAPRGSEHGPDVIAYDYYRPPFTAAVPVIARRTKQPCTPKNRKES